MAREEDTHSTHSQADRDGTVQTYMIPSHGRAQSTLVECRSLLSTKRSISLMREIDHICLFFVSLSLVLVTAQALTVNTRVKEVKVAQGTNATLPCEFQTSAATSNADFAAWSKISPLVNHKMHASILGMTEMRISKGLRPLFDLWWRVKRPSGLFLSRDQGLRSWLSS